MRTALISDIHGNLEALEAVLAAIDGERVDRVVCLGDIVGFGADPEACCARVRERCGADVIAGDWEHAVSGALGVEFLGPGARQSAGWTRERLSAETLAWLGQLPLTRVICEGAIAEQELAEAAAAEDRDALRVLQDLAAERGDPPPFALVHGTFTHPEMFDRIGMAEAARMNFEDQPTPLAFNGHSHVAIVFREPSPGAIEWRSPEPPEDGARERLGRQPVPAGAGPAIVNVGSVGQPRDLDPRACFAIHDGAAQTTEWLRVPYDIEAAAQKIVRAELPATLAQRLLYGR